MKPLMIMVTCNRLKSTKIALASLQATANLDEIDLRIMDNGSTDGTVEWLSTQGLPVDFLEKNVGIQRALNRALQKWRQPNQHVIKMDNDVEILTSGWLGKWLDFLGNVPDVAMIGGVGGNHQDADDKNIATVLGYEYLPIAPMGGFVIYSGAFMDKVGYFDILAPNQLYGFEDNIMVEKAGALKWRCCILRGVRWNHRQTAWAFPGDKLKHVEEMRPLCYQRQLTIARGGNIYTGPDGNPAC